MPRRLPWLTDNAVTITSSATSEGIAVGGSTQAQSRKQNLVIGSDNEDNCKAHQTSPHRKRVKREDRGPSRSSSSPPRRGPPPEEYMHAGYNGDDRYRMVEDEFYAIAQQYTSHVHYAEYHRLMKQAECKGFDAILSLRRPIDGKTRLGEESKKRREAKEHALTAQKAVKEVTGSGMVNNEITKGLEDESFIVPSLHGLLTAKKQKSHALVGLEGVRSDTKAAKGFGSPHKDKNGRTMYSGGVSTSKTSAVNHLEVEVETDDDDSDDLGSRRQRMKAAKVREIFPLPAAKRSPTGEPSTSTPVTIAGSSHSPRIPCSSAGPSYPSPFNRTASTGSKTALSAHWSPQSSSKTPTYRGSALDKLDDFNIEYSLPTTTSSSNTLAKKRGTTGIQNAQVKSNVNGEHATECASKQDSKGNRESGREKGKGRLDEIPLFLG